MAAPAAINTTHVSYEGFDVEHVDWIDLTIQKYVQDSDQFWSQFFDKAEYKKGYTTFKHRKMVRPEITVKYANSLKLSEGIGTLNTDIKVVEWSQDFEDLGVHADYTKEALRDNIDDVAEMIAYKFKTMAAEVPEQLRADAMCTSNFQVTPSVVNTDTTGSKRVIKYPITDTLDRIAVILKKKKCKPTKSGKYVAIMTPELLTALKNEMRDQNLTLDETTKSDIVRDGTVYLYNGFAIVDRSDESMYAGTASAPTGDKLVVICRTRDGELPGTEMPGAIEVFDNGLGGGVIAKSATDATLVADTNKRVGSMALNIDHFKAAIKADLGHLVCTFSHVDYDKTGVTYPTGDPINGATGTKVPTDAGAGTY